MDSINKLDTFLSLVDVDQFSDYYNQDISQSSYFGFPLEPIISAEDNLRSKDQRSVAYFSMEFGLSTSTYNSFTQQRAINPKNECRSHHVFSNLRAMDYYVSVLTKYCMDLPIYSGGLGVLAGDSLKSAADVGISLVGIGILWNKGYFKQNFWFKDGQIPEENDWDPYSFAGLIPLKTRVEIPLKREIIRLKLWKYFVYSFDRKNVIPLILVDSNVEENSDFTRNITNQLYRSDKVEWKLFQRIILGIGGMKAVQKLGYAINRYHLNEGHAALAFIEKAKSIEHSKLNTIKESFAYTCHTPVAAGHDRFQKKLFQDVLPEDDFGLLKKFGQDSDNADLINLTQLAMNTCNYVNAVAQKHGEVTRLQFPQYKDRIQSITNGVHTYTWLSDSMAALFGKYQSTIGDWKKDPCLLKNILQLKDHMEFRRDLWEAHQKNKIALSQLLRNWRVEPNLFTIAWARRVASYKRPGLILQDVKRLLDIAKKVGPMQIIFAGKAHPNDDIGFHQVNSMLSAIDSLDGSRDYLRVLMLENYDTYFGKFLSNSVDVWLNNPLPPFEASGTSGMKAILNGVLQLSTLDGWVVEAADKNIGWIFGWQHNGQEIGDESNLRWAEDSNALYNTLEQVVSLYYQTNQKGVVNIHSEWLWKMISCISEAGFFNTDRMIKEYQSKIWAS